MSHATRTTIDGIWGIGMLLVGLVLAPAAADVVYPDDPEGAIIGAKATSSYLLSAARAGEAVIVVGERGIILRSEHPGDVMVQMQSPVHVTLTDVYFHDANKGWAVGADAVILMTGDGGKSWVVQHRSPASINNPLVDVTLLRVFFSNEMEGLAVGMSGNIFSTTDGGANWLQRELPRDETGSAPHLFSITPCGGRGRPPALYMASEKGMMWPSGGGFVSNDGGETWVPLAVPVDGSMFGTQCLGSTGRVLFFGLLGRGAVYDPESSAWEVVNTKAHDSLLNSAPLEGGGFLAAGLAGALVRGRLVGDKVIFTNHSLDSRQDIHAVLILSASQVLLLGRNGATVYNLAAQ